MRALYIGVDAGGTRTRAVVAAPDLVPLGRGAAGPANAATAPFASVVEAILEAVEDAREAAGVPAAEAHGLVAGVAGGGGARGPPPPPGGRPRPPPPPPPRRRRGGPRAPPRAGPAGG